MQHTAVAWDNDALVSSLSAFLAALLKQWRDLLGQLQMCVEKQQSRWSTLPSAFTKWQRIDWSYDTVLTACFRFISVFCFRQTKL